MERGKKVKVTRKAKYNGQDMRWTETFCRREKLVERVLYHSSSTVLHSFLDKETCFFDSMRCTRGHVYALKYTGPANYYDSDEYRIQLEEGMELIYLGDCYRRYEPKMKDIERLIPFPG